MGEKKMKLHMLEKLACPECKGDLVFDLDKKCSCMKCKSEFPVKNSVINFLQSSDETSVTNDVNGQSRTIKFLRKVFNIVRVSSTFKTKKNKNRIPDLVNSMASDDFLVNIGAGNTDYPPELINFDIEKTSNVDVLADGRKLPLKSGSVSLVISQAVLEHAPDTNANIAEIERIMKPGGLLYLEVPFMQTYHAHPHDYYRFTHQGLRSFLPDFDILEEGISVGPASATALNLRLFLAQLFSFNNKKLFLVFSVLFAWLTLPIKYLDYFMENNFMAYVNSSGIYVLARKKN